MDIGIIGAGVTGLTAAYDLTRQGHTVTVYEARPYAGGLAAGFRDERWEWHLDRFYHHWFASDDAVIGLIAELGAKEHLFFPRPTTSIYHQGRLYPLDSPVPALRFIPWPPLHRAIRVLSFTPLSLPDRLRAGLVGGYLTMTRRWQPLEQVTADAWMRRMVGERAYSVLWKPLLISKFGEAYYDQVNMAWMWARLYKRTAALGYFVGGFQAFVDLLVERVRSQGGRVRLNHPVRGIYRADGQIGLEMPTGDVYHDQVIATCSPQMLLARTPELSSEYRAELADLRSMGAVVLVLALTHPLTDGQYWINLPKSEGLPFMGLVEHTNYVSSTHYGGDHLVYCGDYLPPDHPYLDCDKETLLETYLPGLERINPAFRREWVRACWMFSERYAQPVPFVHHSRHIPPLATPLPGLWMANMSQVYPWDRGTNYAVELGRRVAREVSQSDGAELFPNRKPA
ncbi:MAG TPA: NAD(P)/FAD-dependent oxidoreductase [Chloroflexi bacterium]|nr:NAD(P)/FAD-dependent oxidoreductase [Chloroflexota bacterium]